MLWVPATAASACFLQGIFWCVVQRHSIVSQWTFKISEDALHLPADLMFPQHVLSCAGQKRQWVTHYGFMACKGLLQRQPTLRRLV